MTARPEIAEFAERLRSARTRAGFQSAKEAARLRQINENTYKSYENGIRGIPEFSVVRKLAKAFGVPFVWLLTGEGQGPTWATRAEAPTQPLNEATFQVPADIEELRHSGSIQVDLEDLRGAALEALRRGKVAEARRESLARLLISILAEHPSVSAVVPLAGRGRSDPAPPKLASDGQS